MMTDKLREAAQAVGDAKDILFLREMSVHDKVYLRLEDAINALKAALAEPAIKESLTVAKPVAWMSDSDVGFYKEEFGNYPCVPLYTAPPRREWVGLTDDEIEHLRNDQPWWMVRDIEAKLKEKNT
jgi:hypothetical protein